MIFVLFIFISCLISLSLFHFEEYEATDLRLNLHYRELHGFCSLQFYLLFIQLCFCCLISRDANMLPYDYIDICKSYMKSFSSFTCLAYLVCMSLPHFQPREYTILGLHLHHHALHGFYSFHFHLLLFLDCLSPSSSNKNTLFSDSLSLSNFVE